ncbi:Formyltransferase [Hypoxylon cercidicola]|nr:Formyltransferase [Hypoxylon cercidicola]
MQPLSRAPVATTTLSRAWRSFSTLPIAERNAQPARRTPLLSRAPARPSSPRLLLCRRCQQTRGYGSSSVSIPTTAGLSTTSRDETAKKSEPLRILFCGSDEFSCAALEALHREHVRDPELIRSIDVVARPGKRTGRGYKVIQHPPIRELATKLGLPVHERDTFTGWDMPPHTNLIIAVSFGLFVPPRLLRRARFGGLNLHPSALPDLRGPAPLQHALLAGRRAAAVCLQTLDHAAFDRGLVLARSAPLRIPPDATYGRLRDLVAPLAAGLLVRGLRGGVHVSPLEEVEVEGEMEEKELLHAPKITKRDRRVQVDHLPHLWRRYRALGPLWFYSSAPRQGRKRVILETMAHDRPDFVPGDAPLVVGDASSPVGCGGESSGAAVPYLVPLEPDPDADDGTTAGTIGNREGEERTPHLVVWLPGEGGAHGGACWLGDCRVETVKVEGQRAKPAALALGDFLVRARTGKPVV